MEHFIPVENGQLQGRYVATLCMPAPQLREMAKAFAKFADKLES